MRTPRFLIVPAAVAALAGCAGTSSSGPGAAPAPSRTLFGALAASGSPQGTTTGTFVPWANDLPPSAVTYDPSLVPSGATARLEIGGHGPGVTVKLQVTGMIPRRSYGAHLHTSPCTVVPAQAGPHYQHVHDPKAGPSKPSADPGYANPANEVWLDFTTDTLGTASAQAVERWTFDQDHPPRSLIVHSDVTRTGKGVAGMAGARVACLTLAPR
jgi:Cu-Zn family superoxide dismutase